MPDDFESRILLLRSRFRDRVESDLEKLARLTLLYEQKNGGAGTEEQIQRIAHGLSGAGATLGFPASGATAASLERLLAGAAPHGETARACRNLIAQIRTELATQQTGTLRKINLERMLSPQDDKPDGLSATVVQEPDRSVFLVRGPEEDWLDAAVVALGYKVVAASSQNFLAEMPDIDRVTATIVTDTVPSALQVARQMAQLGPLLLLTSNMSFHLRLAAARVGVTGILQSPLDVIELGDWLLELEGRAETSPLTVLIVEDDAILGESYAIELRRAGMRAEIVGDASLALDRMELAPPDLILLDMQLPTVNGVELARIIRQVRRDTWLPIIFVSSESDMSLQMEARKHGGDDFVVKPVLGPELVSLVRLRANRASALKSLMQRDSLTGLLGYSRFKERLHDELERCRRIKADLTVVFLEIDGIDEIIARLGPLMGDRMIRALSHAVRSTLRRIDVVGRSGQGLACIMLDTLPNNAVAVIERIRQTFHAVAAEIDPTLMVTASVGVAGSPDHGLPEAISTAAAAALRQCKAAGGNATVVL